MTDVQYSTFQTLPIVIIEGVLYQIQLLRFTFNNIIFNPYRVEPQYRKIMQTCTLWRQMILAHMYSNISYNLDNVRNSLAYNVNNSLFINSCADLYYARFIHTVHININVKHLKHEAVLLGLQNIAYLAPHINANKVYIMLTGDDTDTISDIQYCERLHQVAIEVKQITSSASHVDLFVEISPTSATKYYYNYLELAKLLFDGITKTHFSMYVDQVPAFATPQSLIPELVKFSCNWNNSYKNALQIIHANAISLTKLCIEYYHYNELETLFSDDNSNTIVYPNLKHLIMVDQCNQELIPVNPSTVGTPFPSLEKLNMSIEYPFTDDIVFRGNYDTLQELKITATNNLESAFLMNGAFFKRNFKPLSNITIYSYRFDSEIIPSDNNVYVSIMERSPMLKRLFIADLDISMSLITKMQNGTKYKNIKYLHCNEQQMSLEDTINIIKGMPSLYSLQCHISALGSIFTGMNISQIYQLVTTQYAMLGEHIKIYNVLNTTHMADSTAVACAILTACMCPNLNLIRFDLDKEDMTNMFKTLIASRLYGMCKLKVTVKTLTYSRSCWIIER